MDEFNRIEIKVKIDFPKFCYFFLTKLLSEIKEANLDLETTLFTTIDVSTDEYPYCYEAFELIRRTLKNKGYIMGIPTFVRDFEKGKPDLTHYKFKIKRMAYDDLPF